MGGNDGSSSSSSSGPAGQRSSLIKKSASLEDGLFGVLFTIAKDRKPLSTRAAVAIVLIEAVQLWVFVLSSKFEWGPLLSDVVQQLKQLQLQNPIVVLGYPAFLVVFWILALILIACLVICAYVASSFQTNRFTLVWPIIFVRNVFGLLITTLFTSVLNIFLTAFDCKFFDVDQPMLTSFGSTTNDSTGEVTYSMLCWGMPHGITSIAGVLFAGLFICLALVVSMVEFEADLRSENPLGSADARAEALFFLAKTTLSSVNIMLSSYPMILACTFAAVTTLMAGIIVRWLPYRQKWVNRLRAGLLNSLNTELTSPVSPLEVHMAIYPVHEQMADGISKCPCEGCTLTAEHIRAWSKKRWKVPVPDVRCHLSGGKAPGLSRLRTEHVRFPRPTAVEGSLFDWRQRICSGWASMFSQFLAAQDVPTAESFCSSVLTPLHKKGDKADPNNYRGIASGDLLPKVFALVILRRLEHWCERLKVLPPNQAGFRAHLSAEHQVFTLLETLKERRSRGQDSYLLFLDLKKAYDSVPQQALWTVLEKLGIPDSFINLLRNWANRRTVKLRLNGALSADIKASKGLPQGDPLSPLLFNIYISVLMRRIALDGSFPGVSWPAHAGQPPLTIKDLWYADDMVAIAGSAQELQALLVIIQEWSEDWGIEVGIGEGKTNGMHVKADGPPEAPLPQLFIGDLAVPWVEEYRYLGHTLRADLDTTGAAEKLRRRMDFKVDRFFTYNKAIRSLSVATQLQIAQSQVLGGANYLMGVAPYSQAELKLLSKPVFRVARMILGAGPHVTQATLAADSRFMPAESTALMHRWRFMQSLRLSYVRESPAARVLAALDSSLELHPSSWTAATMAMLDGYERTTTAPRPAPPSKPWEIHGQTLAIGRRMSYSLLRNKLTADAGSVADRVVDTVLHRGGDAKLPTTAQALLHCTGQYDRVTTEHSSSQNKRLQHLVLDGQVTTPVSVWAAGCDGSPIALSTRLKTSQCRFIQAFRSGRAALAWWPFHFRSDDSTSSGQATRADRAAFIARDDPCRLCHHGVEHPTHLLLHCQHQEMCYMRRRLHEQAKRLLLRMIYLLRRAFMPRERTTQPLAETEVGRLPAGLDDALRAVRDILRGFDWEADDGKAVLYRLVACTTWSEFDARTSGTDTSGSNVQTRQERAEARAQRREGHTADTAPRADIPLARAVGKVFDLVMQRRSRLRQWANLWALWSYRAVAALVAHHGCALGSPDAVAACPRHGLRSLPKQGRLLLPGEDDDLHMDDDIEDAEEGDSPSAPSPTS